MICVIASIKARDGKRAELLTHITENLPHIHAEAGYIEYQPMIDVDSTLGAQVRDENIVIMVEKWKSMSHLNDHATAPHMLAYREKVKDIVESVTLKVLEPAKTG